MGLPIEKAIEYHKIGAANGAFDHDTSDMEEAAIIAEAEELLSVAQTSYAGGGRSGAAVEVVARAIRDGLVEIPPDNPGYFADIYSKYPDLRPQNGSTPASAPVVEQPTPREEEVPASSESETGDLDAIFFGYDDVSLKDIKAAILSAAASGDLSEAEWEKIKAYESEHEERKSILQLEPEFKQPDPEPAPQAARTEQQREVDYGNPSELKHAYENGTLGQDRATQAGLYIPPAPNGERNPNLQVDITTISGEELTREVMRLHSNEAHTLWMASQEEGRHDVSERLAKDSWASAYNKAFERIKSSLGEKPSASAVDGARQEAKAEAELNESYRTWTTRAATHGAELRTLNALASGYEKGANRLSREQSRRERLAATPNGS